MLLAAGPKNQTPHHYEMTQISKYILWNFGCRYIANEVIGCYGPPIFQTKYARYHSRNIIDTLGIKISNNVFTSYGIEAKVSYSDFKNGFCTGVNALYIIAPLGVLTKDQIPDNVGLILVDIQSYSISVNKHRFQLSGIKIVKKPRILRDKMYPDMRENKKLLNFICSNLTISEIYKNQKIKIGVNK